MTRPNHEIQRIGLGRAIAAMGSAAVLARSLNITPQALSQWRRVPVDRVLSVERITKVPRHELRPDIYPPPVRGEAQP